ncbi:Valencene synthase [Vitis vinifera]|uniref:Valencene synthase n=1 Tax=Vitis vinifera TaxID=29760 RepID=A0A438G7K8_VITVI|nr:Valencene synthase [Vitis vinifera]
MELAKLFLSYLPIHHSRYSTVLSLFQGINMSTQVSASSLAQIPKPKNRPVANYHPNIWGDQFISYIPEDKVTRACKEEQIVDLKKEVKRKLTAAAVANPSQLLNFIDAVQRLGVAYHFEQEIEEALQHICNSFHDCNDMDGDLYNIALGFRLLRQQGYSISCGIFNKFMDERGRFKEALISDVRGMLCLYEAAHLRVHGEDILAKALAFTTTHLKAMVESLGYHLAEQVAHALNRPIRKGMERLEARWYISVYQDEAFHDKTLLELAKLDFNLVQSLHKEELSNLARWWKELDFATKLPFARDRLVEGYFWMHGVYFEPQYLRGRRILTKVIAMTSILDDIHDAYGTPEELKLFIEAIERCVQRIEEEMEKEGNHYRVHYAKEMKNQVRAYFAEAKWLHEEHVPAFEEYMRVALASSGYYLLATTSFVGMGEIATKEAFDWVTSDPKIMSSSNFIARLMDDIKSHKFEQKRRHVASAVECYMKQYGVSEEQVYSEFQKQIENAWLDINQECLKPTAVSMPLLARLLNLTRTADVFYKEQDSYTHVGKVMRDNIASVFINAVI